MIWKNYSSYQNYKQLELGFIGAVWGICYLGSMLAILEPLIFSLCRMVSKNTFPEQKSLL
jgi:hypothetical protein